MNPSDPLYAELVSLISMRLEERESTESAERLDALLSNDAEALALFVSLADIHAALLWEPAPSRSNLRDVLLDVEASAKSICPPTIATPVVSSLSRITTAFGHSAIWSILGVAVLFYGTFALISWNLRSGNLPTIADGNELVVGMIRNETDVTWATKPDTGNRSSENSHHGEKVRQHEPMQIDAGVVELNLADGATLLIEGPAEWSIDSANGAVLHSGTAVAYVPEQAVGFTLDTPTAQIIDRGTEFGVQVHESGKTEVVVLKGCVEVEPSVASQRTRFDSIRLVAGQSVSVERGELVTERSNIDSARFSRLAASRLAQRREPSELNQVRVIPLGNLFDDPRKTSLQRAIETDEFAAAAEIDDLGVERALYGGESVKRIAPQIDFDLSPLGWTEKSHAQIGNDGTPAPVAGQEAPLKVGMRATGSKMKLARERIESGIGIVSNSLITFDLNEIRAAGKLEGMPLKFLVDRAGINDEVLGDPLPSVYAVVLVSDDQGVKAAYLNGAAVKIVERGATWHLAKAVGEPLVADGEYVNFAVPLPATARYLTLIVACAGDQIDGDFVVWSGARLEAAD